MCYRKSVGVCSVSDQRFYLLYMRFILVCFKVRTFYSVQV